jgi:hypothetical protein
MISLAHYYRLRMILACSLPGYEARLVMQLNNASQERNGDSEQARASTICYIVDIQIRYRYFGYQLAECAPAVRI